MSSPFVFICYTLVFILLSLWINLRIFQKIEDFRMSMVMMFGNYFISTVAFLTPIFILYWNVKYLHLTLLLLLETDERNYCLGNFLRGFRSVLFYSWDLCLLQTKGSSENVWRYFWNCQVLFLGIYIDWYPSLYTVQYLIK